MKRATPATISNTHRYLAKGYFFFRRVTPRSITTGETQTRTATVQASTVVSDPNTLLLRVMSRGGRKRVRVGRGIRLAAR